MHDRNATIARLTRERDEANERAEALRSERAALTARLARVAEVLWGPAVLLREAFTRCDVVDPSRAGLIALDNARLKAAWAAVAALAVLEEVERG
jgi:hypothetical protein